MPKKSAGLLVYRTAKGFPEVLLVHPGGPFFARTDLGAWSVPKGEYDEGENALDVAIREFTEETGNVINSDKFIPLTPVKLKSGKIIFAWAVEADFEQCFIRSNEFEIEWPPKSGKKQVFPEVDKAEWFNMIDASLKLNPAQVPLVAELDKILKSFT